MFRPQLFVIFRDIAGFLMYAVCVSSYVTGVKTVIKDKILKSFISV